MNPKEIVQAWLESHGYDGLCNTGMECSCRGARVLCRYADEGCLAGHIRYEGKFGAYTIVAEADAKKLRTGR